MHHILTQNFFCWRLIVVQKQGFLIFNVLKKKKKIPHAFLQPHLNKSTPGNNNKVSFGAQKKQRLGKLRPPLQSNPQQFYCAKS